MFHSVIRPFNFMPKALEDHLPSLKESIPMAFMYGDRDWVSRVAGDRLIDNKLVHGEVFQTEDSTHHLYEDGAEESSACVIKFVHGEA